MHPHPGPASCMPSLLTSHMDLHNTTRSLTCGLDPEDNAVIHPEVPNLGPPSSNAHKPIVGLPNGIDVYIWHICLKGKHHYVCRIKFREDPAYLYECKQYPICVDGIVYSRGLCYSAPEYVSSSELWHSTWWGVLFLQFIYFFVLGCIQ